MNFVTWRIVRGSLGLLGIIRMVIWEGIINMRITFAMIESFF